MHVQYARLNISSPSLIKHTPDSSTCPTTHTLHKSLPFNIVCGVTQPDNAPLPHYPASTPQSLGLPRTALAGAHYTLMNISQRSYYACAESYDNCNYILENNQSIEQKTAILSQANGGKMPSSSSWREDLDQGGIHVKPNDDYIQIGAY